MTDPSKRTVVVARQPPRNVTAYSDKNNVKDSPVGQLSLNCKINDMEKKDHRGLFSTGLMMEASSAGFDAECQEPYTSIIGLVRDGSSYHVHNLS